MFRSVLLSSSQVHRFTPNNQSNHTNTTLRCVHIASHLNFTHKCAGHTLHVLIPFHPILIGVMDRIKWDLHNMSNKSLVQMMCKHSDSTDMSTSLHCTPLQCNGLPCNTVVGWEHDVMLTVPLGSIKSTQQWLGWMDQGLTVPALQPMSGWSLWLLLPLGTHCLLCHHMACLTLTNWVSEWVSE